MIKRIPLILFILSLLSLAYMLIVRLNAIGNRLLTMSSKSGKFIASHYYTSVVLFLVILVLFIISVFVANYFREKRHERGERAENQSIQ